METEECKITEYGTVKISSDCEFGIDKYFKQIARKIKKFCTNYDYDSIYYYARVYKEKDNLYIIGHLRQNMHYEWYNINTEKYPSLAKQLDDFCTITKQHDFEEDSYEKIEKVEKGTSEETRAYLNHLKRIKKIVRLSNISLLSPIVVVPVNFLAFIYIVTQLIPLVTFVGLPIIMLTTFLSAKAAINEFEQFRNPIKGIGMEILLRNKIKRIEKKINKTGNNNEKLMVPKTDIENLYRDGIINYMNSIMNAANKLGTKDKKEKLLELKIILDEYTTKCQKLNNDDSQGLTLNNGKRQIMMDTIEKLTVLEMKIADLLKRNSENKTLFSENEKLMQELDDSLRNIDDGNKQVAVSYKRR